MDWQKKAEDLRFTQAMSVKEIVLCLRPEYFPNMAYSKAYDKVQGYLKRREKYQTGDHEPKGRKWKHNDRTGEDEITAIVRLKDVENITPRDVLLAHKLDPNKWVCTSYVNNEWNANAGGGDTVNLFQSKITVKPITAKNLDAETAANLIRAAVIPAPERKPVKSCDGDYLVEVSIADLHLGKLAWHGETGENYDYKIAQERMVEAIDDIVQHLKQNGIEPAGFIFPIGNDFFNSDTPQGATTAGTQQSNDVRYPKMFQKGFEIIAWAIRELANLAPVRAFLVQGNHDTMSSFYLAEIGRAHV